jgi:hypothetical protein
MVEVWMDEYKSLFYMHRPDLLVREGISLVPTYCGMYTHSQTVAMK